MSAQAGWSLKPLPDKGSWRDRHEVEYEGRTFVVARHVTFTSDDEEIYDAKWCGWSSDPDLMNIIGSFSGETVIRRFTDQIDAVIARGD